MCVEPTTDLLRRPTPPKLLSNDVTQLNVDGKPALLRSRRLLPRRLVSRQRAVSTPSTVRGNFATDGRGRSPKSNGDRPYRQTRSQATRDLLAFLEPQPCRGSAPRCRFDTAATNEIRTDRSTRQAQLPSGRLRRQPRLQPFPDRIDLQRRQLRPRNTSHHNLLQSSKCCADLLRPPA
jgi:hypothetical protein